MPWQLFITGITIGLLSSLHCIGMCGPLALALPVHHLPRPAKLLALSLYNAGRVISYSLIGLVFGIAGRGFKLAGLQQWFSIAAGIVMLLLTAQYFLHKSAPRLRWLDPFYRFLQTRMNRFLQAPGNRSFFLLGIGNGLLPCGMVYLAIAVALTTGSVASSVLLMTFFGLGTLPALFAIGLLGIRIKPAFRNTLKNAVPYLFGAMAVLLVLRGLNLGIPFISPLIDTSRSDAVICH